MPEDKYVNCYKKRIEYSIKYTKNKNILDKNCAEWYFIFKYRLQENRGDAMIH